MINPIVSVYTVIGRDPQLLKVWLHSVESRAGLSARLWEIDLVLWNPTDEVLNYVKENGYRHKIFIPESDNYIENLYTAFGMGYEMSRAKYVFRSGSDQIFSKNFLKNSMELIANFEHKYNGQDALFHLYGVESYEGIVASYEYVFNPYNKHPSSRHILMPNTWTEDNKYDPNYERFDKLCDALRWDKILTHYEYGLMFKHPTKGYVPHCQGPSWIQKKSLYIEHGPYLKHMKETGFTGDVVWMDVMEAVNVPSVLLHNAFTLHLSRGESK